MLSECSARFGAAVIMAGLLIPLGAARLAAQALQPPQTGTVTPEKTPAAPAGIRFEETEQGLTGTESIDVTINKGDFRTLDIKNINGATSVVGWDEPKVRIEARKQVTTQRKPSDRERSIRKTEIESRLKVMKVDINHDGKTLEIKTKMPPDRRSFNMTVDYTIHLPRGTWVESETTNGSATIMDIGKPVIVGVGNGNIVCRNTGDRLEATVGNGQVECYDFGGSTEVKVGNGKAELVQSNPLGIRDLSAKVDTGEIAMSVARDGAFTLDAKVGTGQIDSEFPVKVEGMVSRRARGKVGGGGSLKVQLNVGVGHIALRQLAPKGDSATTPERDENKTRSSGSKVDATDRVTTPSTRRQYLVEMKILDTATSAALKSGEPVNLPELLGVSGPVITGPQGKVISHDTVCAVLDPHQQATLQQLLAEGKLRIQSQPKILLGGNEPGKVSLGSMLPVRTQNGLKYELAGISLSITVKEGKDGRLEAAPIQVAGSVIEKTGGIQARLNTANQACSPNSLILMGIPLHPTEFVVIGVSKTF